LPGKIILLHCLHASQLFYPVEWRLWRPSSRGFNLDVALEIISKEHLTSMVAFHSQQAVEKTMKGIIEEFEIGFVKTHNLERLLGVIGKQVNLDSGGKNGKEKVYLLEG